MGAFTRQCDTLLQGSDAMIQKALHTFGKESIKAVARSRKIIQVRFQYKVNLNLDENF